MANEYWRKEYRNIANISVSDIYNLKKTVAYLRSVTSDQETKKTKGRSIWEKCKPEPGGKPGYLRVEPYARGIKMAKKGSIMSIQLMRSCNGRLQEQRKRLQMNISFLYWER